MDGVAQYLAAGDLERVVFGDGRAFALNDPVVEQAYRIYQAAFARKPDDEGLGYWTDLIDRGASLAEVAHGFVLSQEFVTRYGTVTSHEDYVSTLYLNVLGRQQDEAGAAYWVRELEMGTLKTHGVLVSFSESPENIQRLKPVLDQGVWFDSWTA